MTICKPIGTQNKAFFLPRAHWRLLWFFHQHWELAENFIFSCAAWQSEWGSNDSIVSRHDFLGWQKTHWQISCTFLLWMWMCPCSSFKTLAIRKQIRLSCVSKPYSWTDFGFKFFVIDPKKCVQLNESNFSYEHHRTERMIKQMFHTEAKYSIS